MVKIKDIINIKELCYEITKIKLPNANMKTQPITIYLDGTQESKLSIKLSNQRENIITDNDTPFERIRRITGYLVGTVEKFNDSKRVEVRDRAKHSMQR